MKPIYINFITVLLLQITIAQKKFYLKHHKSFPTRTSLLYYFYYSFGLHLGIFLLHLSKGTTIRLNKSTSLYSKKKFTYFLNGINLILNY